MVSEVLGGAEKAVADAVAASGSMLTKMVLIAEYLDGDGERHLSVRASEELRTWDIAGMLRAASVQLDGRMADDWAPADDGEES